MSSSSKNSPNKRDWESYHDDESNVTIPTSISLGLLKPDSFYISPEKRNKTDSLYEFDGISVLNSPSPLGGTPGPYRTSSPNARDHNDDDPNADDIIGSPKSDYTRMFTQAMLSPGMEDAAPMSPQVRAGYYPNAHEQVPTSRDWFPVDQSPNMTAGDYNGFQNQHYGHSYPRSGIAAGASGGGRIYPGMLNLGDSHANEEYDVQSNPHIQNTYKALQERTRLLQERSGSGGIVSNTRGPPVPLYPEIKQQHIPSHFLAPADPHHMATTANKPPARRKSSSSSSSSDIASTVEDSKRLHQRIYEQQQQERLASMKKAESYANTKDKPQPPLSSLLSSSSSSRQQQPSMKSDPTLNQTRRSPSSGIASTGHESEVVNLSMAASTLASIASPPSKPPTSNIVHSSGLPKGPIPSTSSSAHFTLSMSMLKSITCNCKKSRCLKLYCDCFRMEKYCESCNCTECANISSCEPERKQAINQILDRNPSAFSSRISTAAAVHVAGCKCKKSNCLKKYCECFTGKVPCTDKCRCHDCKNTSMNEQYSNASRLSLKGIAMDPDSSYNRYRSNSTGSLFAPGSDGYNNNLSAPGSASTTSSMGMASLSLRSASRSTSNSRGSRNSSRRKSKSSRSRDIDNDEGDDEDEYDEDEEEAYMTTSRSNRKSARGSSRSDPSNNSGILADILTEQSESPLQLDMDTIIDNPYSRRHNSQTKRSATANDNRYTSPSQKKFYARGNGGYSLSQLSSVSEPMEQQLSPPNSDEAKATVSKLLELGHNSDDERRIREAREASESLLMLSPQRSQANSVVGDINEAKFSQDEKYSITLLNFSNHNSSNHESSSSNSKDVSLDESD